MGICIDECTIDNKYVCCYECKNLKKCIEVKTTCLNILDKVYDYNHRKSCPKYIDEENKDDINIINTNNKSKLTIYVMGDPDLEHTTMISNNDKEIIFHYYDGEGTKYKDICKLLDIAGVEYFTVIKRG